MYDGQVKMSECSGRARVVVLCGPRITHRSTCATLIREGVEVAGICVCDETTLGIPLRVVLRAIRRVGMRRVAGQIAGRVYYRLHEGRLDREIGRDLFDREVIHDQLNSWAGEWHLTRSFAGPEVAQWIESVDPEIIVVHSSSWVPKRVRLLARSGLVIGGHPGLIPKYRGSHAAFWAAYKGRFEDLGCTVFRLGETPDVGPILRQERLSPDSRDSYVTMGWKSMKRIATLMAEVVREYEATGTICSQESVTIPPGSYYTIPTLREYWQYRRSQGLLR